MIRALILALLVIVPSLRAEIVPLTRRPTWLGNVGVRGGIPNRTTVWKTYTTNDTIATINYDLTHSAGHSNEVVVFSPGHYYFNDYMLFGWNGPFSGSGLTIQGATNGGTVFHWLASTRYGNGLIQVATVGALGSPQVNAGYIKDWTSGYAQGASNITINTAEANAETYGHLKAGTVVILDQLNTADFNPVGTEGLPAQQMWRDAALSRIFTQTVEVQSVTGGTNLVINPPLMLTNWSSGQSPQLWFWGDSTEYTGFKNIIVDGAKWVSPGVVSTNADGTTNYHPHPYGIFFNGTKNCFVKDCGFRAMKTGCIGMQCWMWNEVTGCWQEDRRIANPPVAQDSYGINPKWGSFGAFYDNWFNGIPAPIVPDHGCTYSVFAASYATNCVYVSDGNNWMAHMIQPHGAGVIGNLFEQNEGSGFNDDDIHGGGGYNVCLRDFFLGQHEGLESVKNNNTLAYFIWGTNRYDALVGCVLGKSGYHDKYQWGVTSPTPLSPAKSVGRAGHYGNNAGQNQGDALTLTSLILHGNYDVVTAGVKWDASIADHTIPNSWWLSSRPSWWPDGDAWPGIGSDLTPTYNKTPARKRFEALASSGGGGGGGGGSSTGGATGGSTSGDTISITNVITLQRIKGIKGKVKFKIQ